MQIVQLKGFNMHKPAYIKIKIYGFGIFRQYIQDEYLQLHIPKNTSIQDLKSVLSKQLPALEASIINVSAIAKDNNILNHATRLTNDCSLDILPPVCGG